ncbi:MAG: hypothetical protein LUM44_06295 [Pyrinomonadaceae bacterium]|nr:hypothetical protein [Pyrinomonadaceae bacterium]
MTDKLNFIEIFCEEHGRISKVESKSQITCGVTGHYLAFGFPFDRIWEYCCDCEVFQSSKMAKGKVMNECRVCRRKVMRRYMCHNCQTVNFESNQPPRNKHRPAIQAANPDLLQCAGCSSTAEGKKMTFHSCPALKIVFLTTRSHCLFCHQQTAESFVAEKKVLDPTAKSSSAQVGIVVECPDNRCCRQIPLDSLFCPFCGVKLMRCSNVRCGVPIGLTAIFCSYCGTPTANVQARYRRPKEPPAKT